MNENPTSLRVGATGTLDGRRLRVGGRVVVGMEIDGETYYWNEFNLVDGFGRALTLVFEETDDGPEWKLFKWLEPLRAMTIAEAAAKRAGDSVDLDGTPTRITLVDQSRVHHIEGTGPEGVEVGDVASYFNADQGKRMLVASWTGEEIEFYEGRDVTEEEVAAAFGLPRTTPATAAFSAAASSAAGETARSGPALKIVLVGLVIVILFAAYSCSTGRRPTWTRTPAAPPPKQVASALRLANGARGTLAQRNYAVADHAMIEIARIGGRQDRHEYSLVTGTNERALLINGLSGTAQEWHLLLPVPRTGTLATLSPFDAARLRKATPVALTDRTMRVTNLFQSKVLSADGAGAGGIWPTLQYGFLAQDNDEYLLARWTEAGIQFHRGRALSEREVLSALGPSSVKAR